MNCIAFQMFTDADTEILDFKLNLALDEDYDLRSCEVSYKYSRTPI